VQTRTGDEEASMNRQPDMEERSLPSAGDDAREQLLARTLEAEPRGDHPMSATRARLRAAIVAIAPAVLLAAFVYHPYIADLTDKAAVAAALASHTTHWGFSHLVVGVGSGLVVLAFLAIRSWLREAGEERWSMIALPFIVMGSTLFAFLPAMEIAMLGVADAGADVAAVLVAMDPWFFPILITGAITFALGVLGFATGLVRSRAGAEDRGHRGRPPGARGRTRP
jgi:Na+-driven multidrug efflux pump